MTVRWLTFTGVGAMGFVVQIAALWILRNHVGLHYLAATILATELAVLLNFFGHEWWTWADRRAGAAKMVRRLLAFHAANGAISLAGIVLIMPLLIEMARLHYLIANVLTVGICSLANFVAADRVVFRPRAPRAIRPSSALVMTLALVALGARSEAADLRPDTLDAFHRYVSATESRIEGELHGKAPFLWVDGLPDAERQQAYSRLRRGDTLVQRLVTRDRGREIDAPDGLIHHWIAAVFAPGATTDRVIGLMQDYGRYQEIYSPNVRRSRTISRDGDTFKVHLQLFMKKVIGVVLNSEYDVRYTRLSRTRAHVRSYSTRIAEVKDPGTADEKEAPVGHDSGFLWRFDNYCSVEERADGAYIQCESVSLSRAIPAGLGWLVGPFVTSIPRESLEFTLGRMRTTLSYSGSTRR